MRDHNVTGQQSKPASAQDGDVLVLGAGIAGLFAASRLTEAGYKVVVIERSHRIGGTHRSENIGPYSFDVGSIFYEANARLFQMAENLAEMCPEVWRDQRRIAPDGKILHYPVEPREILRASSWRAMLALTDMARSRMIVRRDGTLDAISRQRLGLRFYRDTGLLSYITRFHHVSPQQIDERFFFHRMGFIEKSTRAVELLRLGWRSLASRKRINAGQRRALRIRPFEGYDSLFAPIRERLEQAGVRFIFNENLQTVERTADDFLVKTANAVYRAPSLVSTIPIDALHQALFGEPTGLVSLDMTTLFVSAGQINDRSGHVLFNFHPQGRWKRATIYSKLYPDAPTDRAFMGVEITIPPGGAHDPEEGFADFRDHLSSLGVAQDLRLEGSAFVEHAYPLYSRDADGLNEAALARIEATGIIMVGRQGRFEYLPTSSGVIRRVAEELDKIEPFPVQP